MVFWLLTLLMEYFFSVKKNTKFCKISAKFQQQFSFSRKLLQTFFYKCLLFRWIKWICFLRSNLMWRQYFTLFAIKSQRRGLTAVWKNKRNNWLKRKKQPLRAIPEKEMLLDFINVEIVAKKKRTPSEVFINCLFCWNIYFKEHLIEVAFEAALIVSEIELMPD